MNSPLMIRSTAFAARNDMHVGGSYQELILSSTCGILSNLPMIPSVPNETHGISPLIGKNKTHGENMQSSPLT